jgi:ssDNA-binding Zn-finger/Zn-ribbon topoisomerase 1
MPAKANTTQENDEICPQCGSPLAEETTTATGKRFIRCSQGSWDPQTKQVQGCDYVKWLTSVPVETDEQCPKCGNPLVLATTKTGKKMKKCSTSGWDPETRQATGCDYIEWINGSTEMLAEDCPQCGASLVMYTTANGKRMKKCSTSGWDKEKRVATGCTYIEWQ